MKTKKKLNTVTRTQAGRFLDHPLTTTTVGRGIGVKNLGG